MPTYLDVGVVRVQSYLARSADLRGRRGASGMIVEATSRAAIGAVVGDGAVSNTAAGEADGVVSLVLDGSAQPEVLAQQVLRSLRDALPAAQFEATWGDGSSYVEAYVHELAPRRMAGEALSWLPAVSELPLVRPCDRCAVGAAETHVWDSEKNRLAACRDCERRDAAAGRRSQHGPAAGRTAEEELLAALDAKDVADFAALARLGPGPKTNHLATIYIDGNRVGDLFSAIVEQAGETAGSVRETVSAAMVGATRSALEVAARAVWDPTMPLPVIPHVRGGDDVVVSVPAGLAWRFVRAYLGHFEQAMVEVVGQTALTVSPPTASAGVVIAHQSYPFSTCIDLSERMLTRAKRAGRGRLSTIEWTDVTRHGHERQTGPAALDAWSLADLDRAWGELGSLSGLPRSARASLEEAVSHPVAPIAAARARRLIERLDLGPARPFLDHASGTSRLADALDLVRWWS